MGNIRFAHVHERVSTQSSVVLIIGNLKSNHLGARGTSNGALPRSVTFLFKIQPAQLPRQVLTISFVNLMMGNSESNHVGAQGQLFK